MTRRWFLWKKVVVLVVIAVVGGGDYLATIEGICYSLYTEFVSIQKDVGPPFGPDGGSSLRPWLPTMTLHAAFGVPAAVPH